MDKEKLKNEIKLAMCKRQVLTGHSFVLFNLAINGRDIDLISINRPKFIYEFDVVVDLETYDKSKYGVFVKNKALFPSNYLSFVCPKGLLTYSDIPNFAGLYYYDMGEITEVARPKIVHNKIVADEALFEFMLKTHSERAYLGSSAYLYDKGKGSFYRNRYGK